MVVAIRVQGPGPCGGPQGGAGRAGLVSLIRAEATAGRSGALAATPQCLFGSEQDPEVESNRRGLRVAPDGTHLYLRVQLSLA